MLTEHSEHTTLLPKPLPGELAPGFLGSLAGRRYPTAMVSRVFPTEAPGCGICLASHLRLFSCSPGPGACVWQPPGGHCSEVPCPQVLPYLHTRMESSCPHILGLTGPVLRKTKGSVLSGHRGSPQEWGQQCSQADRASAGAAPRKAPPATGPSMLPMHMPTVLVISCTTSASQFWKGKPRSWMLHEPRNLRPLLPNQEVSFLSAHGVPWDPPQLDPPQRQDLGKVGPNSMPFPATLWPVAGLATTLTILTQHWLGGVGRGGTWDSHTWEKLKYKLGGVQMQGSSFSLLPKIYQQTKSILCSLTEKEKESLQGLLGNWLTRLVPSEAKGRREDVSLASLSSPPIYVHFQSPSNSEEVQLQTDSCVQRHIS